MKQHEIERTADEAVNMLESACWDCANDVVRAAIEGIFYGPEDKLKYNKVRDIQNRQSRIECLADTYYSDPQWLEDLSGDKIYDSCEGDIESMMAVAVELCERGDTFNIAMTNLFDDWAECLEKEKKRKEKKSKK